MISAFINSMFSIKLRRLSNEVVVEVPVRKLFPIIFVCGMGSLVLALNIAGCIIHFFEQPGIESFLIILSNTFFLLICFSSAFWNIFAETILYVREDHIEVVRDTRMFKVRRIYPYHEMSVPVVKDTPALFSGQLMFRYKGRTISILNGLLSAEDQSTVLSLLKEKMHATN